MKKCPSCLALVDDNEMYCPHCDTKLVKNSYVSPNQPSSPNVVQNNPYNSQNNQYNAQNNRASQLRFTVNKINAEKLIRLYNISIVLYIISMLLGGIATFILITTVIESEGLGIFLGIVVTAISEAIMYFILRIIIVQRDFYHDYCAVVNELEKVKSNVNAN